MDPAEQALSVINGDRRYVVIHGDCTNIMPLLPDLSCDHTLCDPPYDEHVHSRSIRRTYLPDVADQPCRKTRAHEFGFAPLTEALQQASAREMARLTKRWVAVFSNLELQHSWSESLARHGLEHVRQCIWKKDRGMPQITGDRPASWAESIQLSHRKGRKRWNGGGGGNVFQHPVVANCSGHRFDRVHTAQKPISLMLELVELFSDPGEIILDPFAGSGTTGVAALRLGRRFIGIELDETYAELARERCAAEVDQSTLEARRAGQVPLWEAT